MQIIPIPCLKDNYAYIINDNISKIVGVVDPSESVPIINFLKKKNLQLNYILNTHHHYDHIGGNIELKKMYNAKIVGFKKDEKRIPGIDITLSENEYWKLGSSELRIIYIPGHTLGHICFYFEKEKIAFTGDTLFSLGCGRIFEGTYEQMFSSLNKIKNLPIDTKIYCGHEYTERNSEFCISLDPKNKELISKIKDIKQKRSNNLPTIPSILKDEIECNIFFRCENKQVKCSLKMKNNTPIEVFTKLRDLKDNF
jgi:hydroxyacylglutathione hydrolase